MFIHKNANWFSKYDSLDKTFVKTFTSIMGFFHMFATMLFRKALYAVVLQYIIQIISYINT